MYILGINAYHGDVSSVILKDGKVVAALEEERFRRIKHWAGFPVKSIGKCLEIAGIEGKEVHHVAISRDPKANIFKKAGFVLKNRPSLSNLFNRAQNNRKVWDIRGPLAKALRVNKEDLPKIHNVEHHPAHLASAFMVSPFEEAAVCAIDGMGDFVSTSKAIGKGNKLELMDKVYFPHSLGILYTAITQYLGFLNYGDEYKVMGLAPYGKPNYVEEIRKLVHLKKEGKFELELPYFRHWSEGAEMEWEEGYPTMGKVYTPKLEELLGPERDPEDEVKQKHMDIAHSLQVVHEEAAFHILNALHNKTGLKKLCLAGGCAMNSVANGKIRDNTPFEEVYIQPAAADNGTALGAAYYVWNQELDNPRGFVMDHALWGTQYEDEWIHDVLDKQLNGEHKDIEIDEIQSSKELCNRTAELVADGLIVGWFQGRMEWGARALGNRSILADPRRADTRDHINAKIKFREKFRPFAPSVKEEALEEFFVNPAPDPFMQQVYPVQPDKREVIPAVTHVDGSGRLQSVNERNNPLYHQLLSSFEKRTGVPVLLNTSFNENEPIVDTPEQALDCFLRTDMDAVVLGNSIVRRVRQKAGAEASE